MIIYTDELEYNYETKKLKYFKGGQIQFNNQNVKSKEFTHDLNLGVSQFNQNVYLNSSDYNIQTESMSSNKDTISFIGKTLIESDEFDIYCQQGFLKKSILLDLSKGLRVELDNEIIESDQLKRDIKNNRNYFTNNVHVIIDEETQMLGENLTQIDK